jgi:peptide deformylase
MSIQNTTQVGNKIIRTISITVSNPKSLAVRKTVKDLIDSMHKNELVGMAAPQIGKNIRIFVTEIRETKLRKGQGVKNVDLLRVFINPVITSVSKKSVKGWEGCGSVASANLFALVNRPTSLTIEALDENGVKFKLKADKLIARVIQHEMDHLNGVVFTDKADTKTYTSRDEYLKLRAKKK